jgi:MFS family permease
VKTVVTTRDVDDDGLAALLAPRTDQGTEVAVGDGRFAIEDGPFEHYERRVEVEPGSEPGRHLVSETTRFRLAIPVWGFLFRPLVARAIRHPPAPGTQLWWAPPDRLDRRASTVLGIVCVYSLFAGYLGVLLSQTNTYFKADFGATNEDVSSVLIAVRIGAFFALFISALADRRGRISVLRWATIAAMLLAATGALAPDLFWLGTSQTLARACSGAIALVIAIVAIEEMPSGARAFAVSMMALSAGLGAGGVVCFLWVADLAPGAWRIFFLVPLLALIPAIRLGRKLPETRRFEVFEQREHGGAETPFDRLARNARLGRFLMLGATAFFFNVFLAPSAAYLNEYFRTERGFSGGQITLLQVITSVPGGLAIVVGGRLADEYGRRLIGTIGIIGGTTFMVAMYTSSGWPIWLFAALSTLLGALTIPALGVYQSELFPTGSRGLANGGLGLLGVIGGVIGLRVAGVLSEPEHYGSFGPVMALLAVGPAIVAVIVIAFYPETAHTELEALNPGDAPLPVDPEALAALDESWAAEHEHRPTDHRWLGHTAQGGVGDQVDHGTGGDRPSPAEPGQDGPGPRDVATPDSTGTIPPRV